MTKKVFLLLLTLICVGCGNNGNNPTTPTTPTTPTMPPPPAVPEPEDVTLTFTMPYPKIGRSPAVEDKFGPGVENATVTCLEGCSDRQTLSTDSSGSVTFLDVYPPLVIEARKDGYITKQEGGLRNNNRVVLSHVWPDEVKESLEHLQIPDYAILHLGENDVLVEMSGWYSCPEVLVAKFRTKKSMLRILRHELYHAHQDGVDPSYCSHPSIWLNRDDEGKAYTEAMEADRKAGRVLPWLDPAGSHFYDHLEGPHENAAEFYAWWAEKERWWWYAEEPGISPNTFYREDLCVIAKARCQFMEERFGPRPDGYP